MNKEEIQDILEELHLVRPEILQPKAKKLFEAIMSIADERDNLLKEKQELRSWLEDKMHNIVPEGCGINYNCEYDSEEDYVRAMEERSSLHTLKNTLDKLNELEGGKNDN